MESRQASRLVGLGPSNGQGQEAGERQLATLQDLSRDTQGHSSFWGGLGHVPDLLASPKGGSLWSHSWDIVARDDDGEGVRRAGVWMLECCADSAFYTIP